MPCREGTLVVILETFASIFQEAVVHHTQMKLVALVFRLSVVEDQKGFDIEVYRNSSYISLCSSLLPLCSQHPVLYTGLSALVVLLSAVLVCSSVFLMIKTQTQTKVPHFKSWVHHLLAVYLRTS